MEKFTPLLVLLMGLLFSQCQRKTVPATPSTPAETGTYGSDDRISLRTTACFGRCPVFEFSIDGTGEAAFDGKRFTDRLGAHVRTFSAAETRALFDAFARVGYFDYADSYTDDMTDLPNRYLTYQRGERSKQIHLYANEPDELRRLEQLVTRAALETRGWQQAPEKR